MKSKTVCDPGAASSGQVRRFISAYNHIYYELYRFYAGYTG